MTFVLKTNRDGQRFIYANGDIVDTTAKDFENFVKANWDAVSPKYGERNVPVLLRSRGGSLDQGLRLGWLIRANHFDTAVWQMCASSCAYAFLGGNERFVAEGQKLGFHQFGADFKDANDAATTSQGAVSYLVRYLKGMQIDPEVLALAEDTTPDKINTPDQKMMTALKITTSEPVPAPAPVAAAAASVAQPKS
jgi:hypothetical protein